MGRIPEATIQEIRDRVDIVDLVGRYVNLKRAGSSYKGLCPFHDEKTPSFNVSPDRGFFHCFGCQAGGDAISFLMKHEGLAYPEAARSLARDYGIEIPDAAPGERSDGEAVLAALTTARDFYRQCLTAAPAAAARSYLEGRGLDAEAVSRLGIGFAPDGWDALLGALRRRGIAPEIGERAGLLKARDQGPGYYDRLRARVVFPIQDARGRVIAFGGRALGAEQEPKYLNTAESPVFHKRSALYGLPFALEPIRRRGRVVVCEGYFDRIALERAGVGEAVATCGTALTPDHARELRRRAQDIVLLFDGDDAGARAAERALEVLLPAGLRVRWCLLPDRLDPDELLTERGPDALREAVDRAADAIELALSRALSAGVATPGQKADVVARIAGLLARIPNPVERTEYARRLASAADTDSQLVVRAVRDAQQGRDASRTLLEARETVRPARDLDEREARHLRQLAAALLQRPELATGELASRIESLLDAGTARSTLRMLCDAAQQCAGPIDLFTLEAKLSPDEQCWLREAALFDAAGAGSSFSFDLVQDIVRWLEKRRNDAQSRRVTRLMREPTADANELLVEKQRLLDERRRAQRAQAESAR